MSTKSNNDKFSDIFANDPLGLLKVDKRAEVAKTAEDQRLIESFQEIVDFYEAEGRAPSEDGDLGEFKLAKRLEAIKKEPSSALLTLNI